MKLYNSLSHRKEEFVPNEPGKVKMYTCGPTVYHFAHIGNLRSYIMEDVLEKYLRYAGYDVTRVMNITDVGHLSSDADTGEDKMLKGAKREHKTVMEIAKFYTDAFFADCDKLNIKTARCSASRPPTVLTEFIKIIEQAAGEGLRLSGGRQCLLRHHPSCEQITMCSTDHNEEDLAVGVREDVEEDTNKRNKSDFVLWFTKSKFEDQALKWDSPWGVGYPGWHIECSCISMQVPGRVSGYPLRRHRQRLPRIIPTRSPRVRAYLGHKWCNYWFHVQHLNTNDGKMSKSKRRVPDGLPAGGQGL